ncbi:glucose dehydrogenase [Haematococcus lacustris]|uniref:Glucose dehydrogenase n=1 Tax=Haematococcus lacustris TaxID=44745 RepID=A0A699YYU5_HAELA|nr:glucose dehydrogenase [Haematococcus lacustris]
MHQGGYSCRAQGDSIQGAHVTCRTTPSQGCSGVWQQAGLAACVWLLVCGCLCVAACVWQLVCGCLCVAACVWLLVCGCLCVAAGVWQLVCGNWCVADGVWQLVCGRWCVAGLWQQAGTAWLQHLVWPWAVCRLALVQSHHLPWARQHLPCTSHSCNSAQHQLGSGMQPMMLSCNTRQPVQAAGGGGAGQINVRSRHTGYRFLLVQCKPLHVWLSAVSYIVVLVVEVEVKEIMGEGGGVPGARMQWVRSQAESLWPLLPSSPSATTSKARVEQLADLPLTTAHGWAQTKTEEDCVM